MIAPNFIANFFMRTELDPETGCMEWQGAITASTGYGKVKLEGRAVDAHRAAWTITHGDIAAGMMICHTCDNRKCVNPRHLFLGTRSDNMIDANLKGRLDMRSVRAAQPGRLSDEDVREIFTRINAGESRDALAERFGVDPTTISKIRYKQRGRYVDVLADLEAVAS
jgi:plasmid stability protein